MGRRLPRRVWHTVAALVPLPLIGLGYAAVVPGNPVAFQVELSLSGQGSEHALTRIADASQIPDKLPREANALFRNGEKGPRADHYREVSTVSSAGKQLIVASLADGPHITGSLGAVSRSLKADRLRPTATNVALKGPVGNQTANTLLMNAVGGSMFTSNLEFDAFKPSPDEIAYHPAPEALNFRYKGESQAEFEARESRCLALAIYFEARGEPVRGQVAVGQVILNRVRSPLFPETICGVVYQGQMQKGCQFSFTCDGKTDNPRNDSQWALAQDISKQIMRGEVWLPEVGYSTYYHANYVSPGWARSMNRIDKIGRHIFYKKRNEEPYVVEASTDDGSGTDASPSDSSTFSLMPVLSLVSSAGSTSGSSPSASTQAMSLGYARSE